MYDYVITAPGQGVQRPGMLDPWLAAVPGAPQLLDEWSDIAGFDMAVAGHDQDRLRDTAVTQPLIVAAALLSLELLRSHVGMAAGRVLYAGHSVGELAAAVGAGHLRPAAAIGLAASRGAAMSLACAQGETGMSAVMPAKRDGAPDTDIVAAIEAHGLAVANHNGSHQFVAAGPVHLLDAFEAAVPAGMRAARLLAAGAFHTAAMAPAAAAFAGAVARAEFLDGTSAMLGNGDGTPVSGPDDLRRRLVAQITAPVRWDRCSAAIADRAGAAPHVELAPAGPLTRLAGRARPGLHTVALRHPADVRQVTVTTG